MGGEGLPATTHLIIIIQIAHIVNTVIVTIVIIISVKQITLFTNEDMIMKTLKTLALASATALSLLSFGSFAQSVSVTDSTLDGAESQIAAMAHQTGSQYRITGASSNNFVRMTAEINSAPSHGLKN